MIWAYLSWTWVYKLNILFNVAAAPTIGLRIQKRLKDQLKLVRTNKKEKTYGDLLRGAVPPPTGSASPLRHFPLEHSSSAAKGTPEDVCKLECDKIPKAAADNACQALWQHSCEDQFQSKDASFSTDMRNIVEKIKKNKTRWPMR